MDFLRDTKNKKELFAFLTSKVARIIWPPDKSVYITSGQYVESINSNRPMLVCNHEEADTRIVVHVMHALEQGMKSVLVRTVDTDVIVILVIQYTHARPLQGKELYTHPDHLWQPGPLLAAKTGPTLDQFWQRKDQF